MRLKKSVYIIIAICLLSLVPTSIALGSNSNHKSTKKGVSGTLNPTSVSPGQASIESSTGATGSGGFGTDYLRAIAIGSGYMDADWALHSTSGPITSINLTVRFDDGWYENFRYSTFNTNLYNSAQNHFFENGYHSATLTGTGYVDFLYSFYLTPLTDGDYVY